MLSSGLSFKLLEKWIPEDDGASELNRVCCFSVQELKQLIIHSKKARLKIFEGMVSMIGINERALIVSGDDQ